MSKRLFNACKKIAKGSNGLFKVSSTYRELAELGYGSISGTQFSVTDEQREGIRRYLKSEFDYDWVTGGILSHDTRLETAKHVINEKFNINPSKKRWVKLMPLGEGIKLNGRVMPDMDGTHFEIDIDKFNTIECGCLILVENVEAFGVMREITSVLDFPSLSLAVYRGDPQSESGVRFINQARKQCSATVGVYADFDPAGMEIALALNPDFVILPNLESLKVMKGSRKDFERQYHQLKNFKSCSVTTSYIEMLTNIQEGFTQERMLAHQIKHQLVWLIPDKKSINDEDKNRVTV